MAGELSSRDLAAMVRIARYAQAPDPTHPLPIALLADLRDLVACDQVWVSGMDTRDWSTFADYAYPDDDIEEGDDLFAAFTEHYWGSPCSYPDRTGDLESVTLTSDFESDRDYHRSGMYCDYLRHYDCEHEAGICLPAGAPGRTLRVLLVRGAGSDFTQRDRDILTLLRPHCTPRTSPASTTARGRSR